MKVLTPIVSRVSVDMVNDLSTLSPGDFAMLPLAARSFATVAKPAVYANEFGGVPVGSLDRSVRWHRSRHRIAKGANHFVPAPKMLSITEPSDLLLVGIEWVAVLAKHLVVTIAQVLGRCGPLAMLAWAPDHAPAPSVLRASVTLYPLVVHKAKFMGGVLSSAALDRTNFHFPIISFLAIIIAWIGERIELVEKLTKEVA